jgi:hypothetical protein
MGFLDKIFAAPASKEDYQAYRQADRRLAGTPEDSPAADDAHDLLWETRGKIPWYQRF